MWLLYLSASQYTISNTSKERIQIKKSKPIHITYGKKEIGNEDSNRLQKLFRVTLISLNTRGYRTHWQENGVGFVTISLNLIRTLISG
jgi:hypothetical protein